MLEPILDCQQTLFDQWQHPFEASQAWPWPVATETVASLVEQQATIQRHGLELTRALAHVGCATATPLIPGGEAISKSVHTAVDDQFDLLRTLHADTVETVRETYTTPADEPIQIDIESGMDESSQTDLGAETGGDTRGDAAPADAAIDYEEIVAGTIPEVQERVETEDVDIDQVIAAERAGKARTTLLDWLEDSTEL